MRENLQKQLHNGIMELFAAFAVDEMAGDVKALRKKRKTILALAELLGVKDAEYLFDEALRNEKN